VKQKIGSEVQKWWENEQNNEHNTIFSTQLQRQRVVFKVGKVIIISKNELLAIRCAVNFFSAGAATQGRRIGSRTTSPTY
jgi:hypothetical protein